MSNGETNAGKHGAVAAINEWSCGLACVCWVLAQRHPLKAQEDLIRDWGIWFPQWKSSPGLLTSGDILNLLPHLGFAHGSFVYLDRKAVALEAAETLPGGCAAGFVLTRKPSQHCMAVAGEWDNEWVELMDPDPTGPGFVQMRWDEVFGDRAGGVLWISQAQQQFNNA